MLDTLDLRGSRIELWCFLFFVVLMSGFGALIFLSRINCFKYIGAK